MRKSIFFCEIRHLDRVAEGEFDSVFAQLKRLGIDGFQFSDRNIEKAGEERLLAALRRHEMHTDVIHIVIPLLSADDTVFENACERACETLTLLRRFDCPRLMVVPLPRSDVRGPEDRDRAMARMIEGLSRILPAAEERGIEVYIENFSSAILPYSTVSDIEHLTDALPKLKYTFDVGNFLCVGEDPFEAYARLHPRVSLLHLKNFTPTDDADGVACADGHRVKGVAFDEGDFDMPAMLRACRTHSPDVLPIIEHNAALSMAEIERTVGVMEREL